MGKLKIGIIGCGGIAQGKHMPALAKIEKVEMVAFCDLIEERVVAAKNTYGSPESEVFTDYKEMLSKTDIDIVHVCTPNISHAEISIAAMEAGCHVMCAKPMDKTAAEAIEMIEAIK